MNENEMTDLLRRATRDLSPDVGALVAGGLQRGRVRQRRRRTATAVGAALATAVVAVGVAQLAGEDASRGLQDVPADRPTTATAAPTPTSTPASTPAKPATARLAVTTDQVPTTFASLVPGTVGTPDPKSGPDAAPVVDFQWNGYAVRVGLTPAGYAGGSEDDTPGERCAQSSAPDSCRSLEGQDGSVVSTWTGVNPPVDGGTSYRAAEVFRADGWDVLVMTYNGPAREGPVSASEPPFTLTQLVRVASSDVWFR
jgi:hypothetical protein